MQCAVVLLSSRILVTDVSVETIVVTLVGKMALSSLSSAYVICSDFFESAFRYSIPHTMIPMLFSFSLHWQSGLPVLVL